MQDVQPVEHIFYKQKEVLIMQFEFYVNGEQRKPNEEECKKMIHNMLLPLGFEENKKPEKKKSEVSA